MCAIDHPHLKVSREAFEAGTVRVPRFPNEETYQRGHRCVLWMRHCPLCDSSVYLRVESER